MTYSVSWNSLIFLSKFVLRGFLAPNHFDVHPVPDNDNNNIFYLCHRGMLESFTLLSCYYLHG
jgi:hypothetical protein